MAHQSESYQHKAHNPTQAPLPPWEFATRAWQRIHIDFVGLKYGYIWLMYVNAHSKYLGTVPLTTTTAHATSALLEVCVNFGISEKIVSANGPPFYSEKLTTFCRSHQIKHLRSLQYHPQLNGKAERFVQTFKDALESAQANQSNVKELASVFCFVIVTPHSSTGSAPAQLLISPTPRIQLDLRHPDIESAVRKRQ